MPTPQAVVFDIGNVLVTWDWQPTYEELIPDAAMRNDFLARVDIGAMNLRGDHGELSAEVKALAAQHPDDAKLIEAFLTRWPHMFGEEIIQSAQILRALKQSGIPVFALSNFAADTYPKAQTMFDILRDFDLEIISGREGITKPDPAIYELLEARSGMSGEALFFVDDRADNIQAATIRGWQGHVFETAPAFEKALRATGLVF